MERTGLGASAGALSPGEALHADAKAIGGKAHGLAKLSAAGLRVPPWCVVPGDVAAQWLCEGDDALRARLAPLVEEGGLAIRSSSPLEDAAVESHAGQFNTRFAAEADELAAAFRGVCGMAAIPVVLQRALQPDVAGVAFSANPAAARPRELLIEAVRGHGEKLVSGQAEPERIAYALDAPTPETSLLPENMLHQLAEAVLQAEEAIGAAADVEWCVAEDELWILQARPITAMQLHPALLPCDPITSWFFDQRFPDPVSPFTRDTLLPLIAEVSIGDALRMRGREAPFPLLHFHAGRPYAPVRLYYDMLDGAPRWWLSPDLRQVFGVRGRAGGGLAATVHYAGCAALAVMWNAKDVFLNLRAWEVFRGSLQGALRGAAERMESWEHFEREWRRLDDLSRRFLRIHRWSILWADYFYRGYGMLPGRLRRRWDEALRGAVRLPTAEANAAMLRWRAEGSEAARALVVGRYGDRSGSLDYAVETWGEMAGEGRPPAPFKGGNGGEGEKPSDGGEGDVPTCGVAKLRWPLRVYARLMELREEQRFTWEHILARQRRMVLGLARTLVERGLLPKADDVWLLRWEELRTAVEQGVAPTAVELRIRRHEQRVFAAVHPPALVEPQPRVVHARADGVLRGVGASAGVGRGRVLRAENPAALTALPPQSVLVARALDPACSGIMRHAAGLVIERGGLLSHASILAREYGVPLVIGVEHAMEVLREGEEVEVNGGTGEVRRGGTGNSEGDLRS